MNHFKKSFILCLSLLFMCGAFLTAAGVSGGYSRDIPVITTEPVSLTVVENAAVSFTIVATGTAPLTYIWQKNDADISGAIAATYTIAAVVYADSGSSYRCIVSNAEGVDTSGNATLTVTLKPPLITTNPPNRTVAVGETATFNVVATGTARHYKWQRDSVDISGAPDTAYYTTPVTTMADSGAKFRCIVSNSGGSDTSNQATLTVRTPPLITTDLNDTTVNEGIRVTFRAKVSGSFPFTWQWYRNDTIIQQAPRDTYQTRQLTIIDSGSKYKYIVSNSAGKDTSKNAVVNVNLVAPVITQQPANDTVYAGSTAQFRVRASFSRLTYQWQKNGVPLTDTNAVKSNYPTPPTTPADSGAAYTCVVTNPAGSVTSNPALLIVYTLPVPPQIVVEPADVSAGVGDSATFKVSASGTTLSFKWQRKNNDTATITDVFNATDSIYKKIVAQIDNGRMFRCIVSNPGGKDTSVFAKLNVTTTGIVLSNLKRSGTVFQIGPNPSVNVIHFKYLRSDQQKGTLVLFDAIGNKVYEKECFLNPGDRSFLTIDLKNTLGRKLGSGAYLAILKVKNGKGVTESFVQQVGVKIQK
jgi:hypothetical protein